MGVVCQESFKSDSALEVHPFLFLVVLHSITSIIMYG